MSAQTREAINAAIRAHAADEWEAGALITDWTLVAATVGSTPADNGTGMISSRDGMPSYVVKGLLVDAPDDIRAGYFDDSDDEE
ncbi:hypothetical protein [Microbacterium sp. K24]|uniref:hypothetical protein n=1 Tax=Microbacterium sp. K24 TaxID=2305446 RepID=UPI00109C48DA|nr:hypothetical protein [Microbacterium sp. K24]